ncbi:hypothetical protein [Microbacterium algeriense]|uniref:hypothetical protein n=1 Tax=Microbacterium algeriense TaxID=2615184 RepID=UPI0022E415E3|nr:hypothetical protein [Microbacterium algeriense]
MADDLSDALREIRELKRQVKRLQAARPLENASITNGRVRFVGGLLRVDSGGRVEIIGQWRFVGTGAITGDVVAEGKWTQNGGWEFNGPGDIAGDVDLAGDMNVTGNITVTGSGRVKVGNMTLDPSSNGGSMKFSGGPEVYAAGSTLALYSGALNGASIELGPGLAKVSAGGARWIEVNANGFRLVGLPTISRSSANNATVGTVYSDASGNLYRVVT